MVHFDFSELNRRVILVAGVCARQCLFCQRNSLTGILHIFVILFLQLRVTALKWLAIGTTSYISSTALISNSFLRRRIALVVKLALYFNICSWPILVWLSLLEGRWLNILASSFDRWTTLSSAIIVLFATRCLISAWQGKFVLLIVPDWLSTTRYIWALYATHETLHSGIRDKNTVSLRNKIDQSQYVIRQITIFLLTVS